MGELKAMNESHEFRLLHSNHVCSFGDWMVHTVLAVLCHYCVGAVWLMLWLMLVPSHIYRILEIDLTLRYNSDY